IALAAIVLAAAAFRHDPAVAIAGVTAGLAVAVLLSARVTPRAWVMSARRMLADDRIVIGAVFVMALGLRLLYTARVLGSPNSLETGPDARFYDRLAWSLVQGRSIVDNGYPLLILGHVRFLAVVYRLF